MKRFISSILIVIMIFSLVTYTASAGVLAHVPIHVASDVTTAVPIHAISEVISDVTITIPSFEITINDKAVDSTRMQYPLIVYNGITYFPLTWRFVVDELGWDQSWNSASGFKLSTSGKVTEYSPGDHYHTPSVYTLENYRDYAIIEKVIEERFISAKPDEYGNYSDNYEGRSFSYYKLNYATNTLTEIPSQETTDAPYHSGAIQGVKADESFSSNNHVLYFKGSQLLDLSEDAGAGNTIDKFYATKHLVNGMTVYLTSVTFTQDGTSVPAPYTPHKYYSFIDKGDGILHPIDSWPKDQILSAVYPYKNDGIYLSSTGRIFGNSRYNNGRGWVCIIHSNLSVTTLNEQWENWNSVEALGTDDKGNLYLLNTWFPNFDLMNVGKDIVSPINDGFFRLDTDGNLTKIHPFVHTDQVFVTPSGQIYGHANWMKALLHLQTHTRITF